MSERVNKKSKKTSRKKNSKQYEKEFNLIKFKDKAYSQLINKYLLLIYSTVQNNSILNNDYEINYIHYIHVLYL